MLHSQIKAVDRITCGIVIGPRGFPANIKHVDGILVYRPAWISKLVGLEGGGKFGGDLIEACGRHNVPLFKSFSRAPMRCLVNPGRDDSIVPQTGLAKPNTASEIGGGLPLIEKVNGSQMRGQMGFTL